MRKRALFLMLSTLSCAAHAQGFLPGSSSSTATTTDSESTQPILIGERVPESLAVISENGQHRTLLSYKSSTEVLVVTFLSPRCDVRPAPWAKLRRLHDRYEQWRVAFVAVSESAVEMLPELSRTLAKERLPWPAVHDEKRKAATILKISGTPEVLIIDEYGALKYRGPVAGVPDALATVIGHIDAVENPEPPMEGMCPF